MFKTKQADNEIHGDQLVNFLVNTLSDEIDLDLGDNAEIDAEDLGLYAVWFQRELTACKHDPLQSSDEVRAGTARTSR